MTNLAELGVSWSDAKKKGLAYYFTGKPCKHGHVSIRLASSGNCDECFKTTHKEIIYNLQLELVERRRKEGSYQYKQKINNPLAAKAYNSRKKWDSESIKIALSCNADGYYIYTAQEVASILGRSFLAVEHVRNRHGNAKGHGKNKRLGCSIRQHIKRKNGSIVF